MANKDVYMDTRVFTDIVNRIGGASSKCVLSANPLSKADVFEETSVGKEMNEILKLYYKSTEVYRNETSDSLPRALLKVRDSMIEQDKILSEGLTVEKNRR
ncbi:hypothetical protein [Butyrivibrio sp. LB2008]|uniref:hypothetical protein n=1 Tax=Butyrivibrio sp. LB2008 TaxID=1408305 RepID=UPI00047A7D43|nr:hypothetical protein [Butyrivibrio sp. LB2008]